MPTLEKLKARIHELVPETMELSFGCKFHWEARTPDFSGTYTVTQTEKEKENRMTVMAIKDIRTRDIEDICKFDERILTDGDFVILGHPITLVDVLRAINKSESLFMVDSWGVEVGSYTVAKLLRLWNAHENLDSQLPAVHEFLLEILEKK